MNGWEPSTTHAHVYDQEGRLVQTIVTRETEWTPDDVALLIAQAELEADLGPHGQPMSEATDGLADPNLRGEGWGYEAFYTRDYAAIALRQGPEILKQQYPDQPMEDLVWGVRKVTKTPIEEPRG